VEELKEALDGLAREAAGRARPVGAAATLRRARVRRRRRTGGAALATLALAGAVLVAGQHLGGVGGDTTVPVAPVPATAPLPSISRPVPTTTAAPHPAATHTPSTKAGAGPATTATRPRGTAGSGGSASPAPEPAGPLVLASGRRSGATWRLVELSGVVVTLPAGGGPVPPPVPPVEAGPDCLSLEWSSPAVASLGCGPGRLSATDTGPAAPVRAGQVDAFGPGGSFPARAVGGWAPAGTVTVRLALAGRGPLDAHVAGGRAWVAFPPAGALVTSVVALDGSGRRVAGPVTPGLLSPAGVVPPAPVP
jgi:hypothetical protein